MHPKNCPFCRSASTRLFHEGTHILDRWDVSPLNPEHTLLVPQRHVPIWDDAARDERQKPIDAIEITQQAIRAEAAPDGFNVGMNLSAAGGQTAGQLRPHAVPRYGGDVDAPCGGLRWVILGVANYWG